MLESTMAFIEKNGASLNSSVRELRDTTKERSPLYKSTMTYENQYFVKDTFKDIMVFIMDFDDANMLGWKEQQYWAEFLYYEENDTGYLPERDTQYKALDKHLMDLYEYTKET